MQCVCIIREFFFFLNVLLGVRLADSELQCKVGVKCRKDDFLLINRLKVLEGFWCIGQWFQSVMGFGVLRGS